MQHRLRLWLLRIVYSVIKSDIFLRIRSGQSSRQPIQYQLRLFGIQVVCIQDTRKLPQRMDSLRRRLCRKHDHFSGGASLCRRNCAPPTWARTQRTVHCRGHRSCIFSRIQFLRPSSCFVRSQRPRARQDSLDSTSPVDLSAVTFVILPSSLRCGITGVQTLLRRLFA